MLGNRDIRGGERHTVEMLFERLSFDVTDFNRRMKTFKRINSRLSMDVKRRLG
jgi:hypothetical protein